MQQWSAPQLEQAVELTAGILPREYESFDELPPVARRMWPTPLSSDGEKGGPGARHGSGTPSLPQAVTLWPTPQAHDSRPGYPDRVGRHGTKHGDRNLNDETVSTPGSCLNPAWVEALMGFPDGWTWLPTAGRPRPARRSRGSRPAPSEAAPSPTGAPG